MTAEMVLPQILNPHAQALIIRSFGAGNAPSLKWLLDALAEVCASGTPVINVSQCSAGSVEMTKYEAGRKYHEIGLISAGDMTFEAALCKTMFLLGKDLKGEEFKEAFAEDLKGEVSI
jgi:L-asparaginase